MKQLAIKPLGIRIWKNYIKNSLLKLKFVMSNKIIRSICYFTDNPSDDVVNKLGKISKLLSRADYSIQTKRICASGIKAKDLSERIKDKDILLGMGSLGYDEILDQFDLLSENRVSFNLDLSIETIEEKYVNFLFNIIEKNPEKTFEFAYVFNNAASSPYFPSATYKKEGFAIGLQPTDLSENCHTLDDWLNEMKMVWQEINLMFKGNKEFLGVDSSIAPLFQGQGSLVNFIKRLGFDFNNSVVTDIYTRITNFIKQENPNPIGLCGLMLPCLEDFELANEYEQGNFTIERNLFLSLHSGLGIDTYPIGIDEDHKKVLNILKLVQALSNKYKKPLSIRFVSDGKAKIGSKTDFKNEYLKDVTIKQL